MNRKLVLAISALILASGAAVAAIQEGRREAPRGDRTQQEGRQHRDRDGRGQRGRRHRRPGRQGRIGEALQISEAQRAQAREAAKALAPLADEVRPQARAILERARDLRRAGDVEGARALLRDELRPLLQQARERAVPYTRPLVDSLTPEQRARIDAALARRGRSFDADRAAARLALFLARRGAR